MTTDLPGRLFLLRDFELSWAGADVALPRPAQRLIACVALHPRAARSKLAGLLWPETNDRGALRNVRTAVWLVQQSGVPLLSVSNRLELTPAVRVDVDDLGRGAAAIQRGIGDVASADLTAARLGGELLPDWDDDWVLMERERLRQLQLHALEAAAWELSRRRAFPAALEAAVAAVQREPLRETAQLVLVSVHLAEGNPSEALRQFDTYRQLLRHELGIAPSERLCALVQPLLAGRAMAQRRRERQSVLMTTG